VAQVLARRAFAGWVEGAVGVAAAEGGLGAGALGFIGNEIAAYIRLRAGRRLNSPALVADGYHARTDGLVSLGVILSALVVSVGLDIADPLIRLAITLVIIRITWHSWQTIRAG